MRNKIGSHLFRSLFFPLFLMTLLLLPLLFILVKRYFSMELIPFSIVNSFIMTGGMFLNIFIFIQLSGKISNFRLYLLIAFSSAGFSVSGLIYIIINHPLFFLYGFEVMLSYIGIVFIIIVSLSFFSSGLFNYQKIVDEEKMKRETEIKLRESMEREIYSSKISPHFLFNSLNLMVSLLDDKDKAEHVLISLSELLRFNIEASKMEAISVREEIDSVKKYLYIQKERFGNRLNYVINGESEVLVPPLLIQPLVENSIKHNLERVSSIKVTIDIEEVNNSLKLRIKDSAAILKDHMVGSGTGLEVTKKRVELTGGIFKISNGGIEICLPVK